MVSRTNGRLEGTCGQIVDAQSAAGAHRSRADELTADMRSGTLDMDQMRDAFDEATWHQAQARRLEERR